MVNLIHPKSSSRSVWFVVVVQLLCVATTILVALVVGPLVVSGAMMPEIELVDKSFSLDVLVTIRSSDSIMVRYDIRELHSAWQKRSILHYRASGKISETLKAWVPRKGTFYASDMGEILLKDGRADMCLRKDREFVDQVFNLKALAGIEQESKHLIGATRLLAYLNANRDKFSLLSSMGALKFKSEPMRSSQGTQFTLLATYRNVAGANLPQGIPRTILINKSDGAAIFYDFNRYVPIPEHQAHYGRLGGNNLLVEQYELGDQTILFDLFAWERAMGCSKETVHTNQPEVPVLSDRNSERRFSFTARFKPTNIGLTIESMVGYEPALTSLRVERTSAVSFTSILIDYKNDRSFHMLRRKSSSNASDLVFDRILQTDRDHSCVATRASAAGPVTSWRPDPPTLGQLLLGTHKLTYLGLARVRGAEARTYEAYDCEWPVWYEQPSVYKDESQEASVTTSQPGGGSGLYKRSISGPLKGPKKKQDFLLNCVYYFSRTSQGADEILDASLLLIEVFKVTAKENKIIDRMPIHIYDFSWQLNTLAPNNQRWQDFFALGDQCLADPAQVETSTYSIASASSQHVTINMVLENHQKDDEAERTDTDWLKEATRRNLALIRTAQEHFLPSNMIYDLESRFPVYGHGQLDRSHSSVSTHPAEARELMTITMEAAERSRDIAQLIFLGVTNFKSGYLFYGTFRVFMTLSMQSCSMIAAHQRRDTLIAFDARRSCCFILKDESMLVDEGVQKLMESMFDMNQEGALEVYKVEHQPNVKLTRGDYFNSLAQHRDRLVNVDRLVLTDPMSLIPRRDNRSNEDSGIKSGESSMRRDRPMRTVSPPEVVKVSMKIKQFEVNHLEEKSRPSGSSGGGGANQPGPKEQLVNLSKFPGLGLIEGEHRNRLIVPRRSESVDATGSSLLDQTLNSMTFERCQAACLAELTCNSFSTCTRNGTIECILSEIAFNTPFLAGQLALIVQKRTSKFVTYFPVTLVEHNNNDGNATAPVDNVMNLRKQITCELHNKQFSELFLEKKKQAISVAQRVYRPVDNLEQCAKLCLEWTLDMLRKRTSAATAVTQSSTSSSTQHGTKLDSNGVCNHFFYVDHIDVIELGRQMQSEQAQRAIDYLLGEQKTGGYCVLDKPLGDQSDEPDAKAITGADAELVGEAQFSVRKYQFDYRFLFEQQFGWSLIESRKTSEELKAYDKLFSIWQVSANETEEAIKTMQPFLDRSENSGYWLPLLQIDECARTCFQHSARLWPGCRSFEYIEITRPNSPFKLQYCAFNSITLRQAVEKERFDLVRQGEAQERVTVDRGARARVWHYEPKQGLVTGSLEEAYKQILAEDHQYGGSDHNESGRSLPLGGFSLFCIISITLLLGLVCGIKIAFKILAATKTTSGRNDLDSLVDIVERKNDDEQL